jgi:acyl-CoA thioesterase
MTTNRLDPAELARRSAAAMYAEDAASRGLGITVTEVTPGQARARMTVTEAMVNGHGIAHGGFVFLLADSAFAFACNTYGRVTVARAAEVAFIAPARLGDDLVALAVERARYGRNGIYDVTVQRADGGVVAEFRGHSHTFPDRLIPLAGQDDPPSRPARPDP